MKKSERLEKMKELIDKEVEICLSDKEIKNLAEEVRTSILEKMKETMCNSIGLQYRWSHWEVSSSSPLYIKLKEVIYEQLSDLKFTPTPLTKVQETAIQKIIDKQYFESMKYKAIKIAQEMAEVDLAEFLKSRE